MSFLGVYTLLAVATFVAISLATGLNFGWINALDVPGRVVTLAPLSLIGEGIRLLCVAAGRPELGTQIAGGLLVAGVVVSALIVAYLAVTVARRRPVTFLSWSYLWVALLGPAMHSWYLLWGGLLLPGFAVFGAWLMWRSAWLALRRGGIEWRGVRYDAGLLKDAQRFRVLTRLASEDQLLFAGCPPASGPSLRSASTPASGMVVGMTARRRVVALGGRSVSVSIAARPSGIRSSATPTLARASTRASPGSSVDRCAIWATP